MNSFSFPVTISKLQSFLFHNKQINIIIHFRVMIQKIQRRSQVKPYIIETMLISLVFSVRATKRFNYSVGPGGTAKAGL